MPRACRQAVASPAATGTRTAGIASCATAVPGIASSIARAMAALCTAVTRDTATGSWNSGYAYGNRSPIVFRCAPTSRPACAG